MNKLFPYERFSADLLHGREFVRRVGWHFAVASCAAAVALGIGTVGYRVLAGLSWIDAFLNAAMILGGMGPVATLTTTPAKLFAGLYALFSGLVFVGVASVLMAPFSIACCTICTWTSIQKERSHRDTSG